MPLKISPAISWLAFNEGSIPHPPPSPFSLLLFVFLQTSTNLGLLKVINYQVCGCTWKFVTSPSAYFSYHYYLFIYSFIYLFMYLFIYLFIYWLIAALKFVQHQDLRLAVWFLWAAFLCHAPHHFGSSFLHQFSTYSCEILQIYFVWHDNVMLPR